MIELTSIQQAAVWIIPVLFAITVHEAAHGWVAYKLGDTTAKMLGRLTFNPIKHIDPVGTIAVPILVLVLSNYSFVFGWAKPVPINSNNFRKPRRDMALATAAGPASNLLMAIFWAIVLKLATFLNPAQSAAALFMLLSARAGILINLLLAYLNLIPIPPLDGSRIVASLLPARYAMVYQKIEPFGFFILLAMMLTGVLNWILTPLMKGSLQAISSLLNI
ncbi:site-2 protease family protein [Legionella dresdenensis]|uniref:Site-2 protease family protein n=1 Tax=Legionella dresdenensis TaxID=450200 RepID=A0ABV8CCC1_9GAMM